MSKTNNAFIEWFYSMRNKGYVISFEDAEMGWEAATQRAINICDEEINICGSASCDIFSLISVCEVRNKIEQSS